MSAPTSVPPAAQPPAAPRPGDAAPPPSPWRRRRFTIALVAALAVLAGAVVYLALGVDVSAGSPTATVVSYLDALASGDARAALAAGAAPADRTLLTGAVLNEQRKLAPISHIRVLGVQTGDYGALVHVGYRVGGQDVDDRLTLVRDNGEWRLDAVAVDLEISGGSTLPELTVFGQHVSAGNDLWVFPGAVQFTSADEAFAISPQTAVFTDPDVPAVTTLTATLTPAGTAAGTAALAASLQACAASRSLAPAGCPQHASRPAGAVTGSWRWAIVGVENPALRQVPNNPRRVNASATVVWRLTYRVQVKKRRVTRTLAVRTPVHGVLDYAEHPVSFTAYR